MIKHTNQLNLIPLLTILLLYACTDAWEDRLGGDKSIIAKDLTQVIHDAGNLNIFYDYLVKTGYDKELESSKSYTVWAPSDEALAGLETSIVNDTAQLKHVIGFYITLSTNLNGKSIFRQKMLNGKYAEIDAETGKIEDAVIIEGSNVICKNGILHTIDKAYLPKKSTWEYLSRAAGETKQSEYINKLFAWVFDEENSVPIGVDEYSGMTVYDSVKIWKNIFLMNIADLEAEEDLHTFIMLSDNAFDEGLNRYKTYYRPADTSHTDSIASYNVCADLVFRGKHTPGLLPLTLISTTGILVEFPPSIIDSVYETSNGIIYFVNTFPVAESSKFKPIVIEGENPDSAMSNLWVVRKIDQASGGYDLFYDNKVASSWVQYNVSIPYPAKYRFFWVAVSNPVQTYLQKLSLFTYKPGKNDKPFLEFPVVFTTTTYSSEIPLGTYTFNEATSITLRVFSYDDVTLPPLALDYIKILPVND